VNFKEVRHKNSLNYYNQSFKFFDLSFSKELFYKIIVKSPEEEKKVRKKNEEREQSPIKNENFELKELKDFKENILSKSLCLKMSEERILNQNEHILALSKKMNVIKSQFHPINKNRKQEKLSLSREQFLEVPNPLIKRQNLLTSSKKNNKIFEPLPPPELPFDLKVSGFI